MFTETFWTAVGSIAAAIAVIGAFVGWIVTRRSARASRRAVNLPPKLLVRRVVDPEDEDLRAAYDVYEKEIENESERDSFSDIQRWLDEAAIARASGDHTLDEYLLIGTVGAKVCAFFYGQYYSSHRVFLVGYLVIDHESQDARRATSAEMVRFMFATLGREHPECAGVVFELALEPGKDPRARIGKQQRFGVLARTVAHVALKRLDFEYRQPRLSLWYPNLTEERQHLVYGRVIGPPLGTYLDKQEVAQVLDAVYNCWYGDYYQNDPSKDAEYRQYVRELHKEVVSSLPDPVPLLT